MPYNDSYYALLDAGTNWFEAHNSLEFLLQEGARNVSSICSPSFPQAVSSAPSKLKKGYSASFALCAFGCGDELV